MKKYVEYFDGLARQVKPFEIRLQGIGSFDQMILYLAVSENPSLDHLHRKVVRNMKHQFGIEPDPLEGESIRFHATVCKPQTPDVFDEARKMLKQKAPDFTFQATDIAIFYHLGGAHSWIIYRQMPLQG